MIDACRRPACAAGGLGPERRAARAQRHPRRAELTTAQLVPNAKLPPLPIRPWIGRRSACTLPPGNGPSSCATVPSAVEPPGPGPKRIGVKASR